jgi:hypothetical protein
MTQGRIKVCVAVGSVGRRGGGAVGWAGSGGGRRWGERSLTASLLVKLVRGGPQGWYDWQLGGQAGGGVRAGWAGKRWTLGWARGGWCQVGGQPGGGGGAQLGGPGGGGKGVVVLLSF